MKLVQFLFSPLPLNKKLKTGISAILLIVFVIALTAFMLVALQCSLFSAAASACIIGIGMLRWRVYLLPPDNSPVTHLLCFVIGFAFQSREPAALWPPELLTDMDFLLSGISALLLYILLSEYVLGVVRLLFGREQHGNYLTLFLTEFLISASFFFTIYLFIPSETYFNNINEVQYSYWDFAPYFLKKMLLHSAFGAAFLCTLNQKPIRFFNCLLTGLLLCVYCQYMFMNSSLPILGVNDIDWGAMAGQSIINAAVWILLLLLPFIAGTVIRKIRKGVQVTQIQKLTPAACGILGGIQLVTLLVMLVSNSTEPVDKTALYLSGTEQFTVSANKNIVTFILDAADQDYFDAKFSADPESAQVLKDFTSFSNTSMQYDSTYLSIPSMLTAARTYPETDVSVWYDEICNDEPARVLYQRLHDNNYKVNVFGEFSADYTYTYFQDAFDNLHEVTPDELIINYPDLYDKIGRMAAYRLLPVCLKLYTDPGIRLGNESVSAPDDLILDNSVFSMCNSLTLSESEQNYYIVQHLTGVHNHGNGQFKWKLDMCLSILEQYFDQMKQFGIYDDALIIVTADHGQHVQPKNMPIFYIKKPHETHDAFETCRAPVCLSDYAATVLDAAGLSQPGDEAIFGKSVFDIPENAQRTRLVFQRKPFSNIDKIEWKRYNADHYTGTLFGYYFTGTKDDLEQHELNDPPDLVIETDGYR